MKITIALCTWNGEDYLAEQLQSLANQTRRPDELIAMDDASTDGTPAILEGFARDNPMQFNCNPTRFGSSENFSRAIARCTGDVVVLADQDDVWEPTKLATIERTLSANPDAGFCFSDATIVDRDLQPLGYQLWEALDFGSQEQAQFRSGRAFESLLRRHRVTGATMAFRSHYRDLILPIPTGWVHDAWIALLISAVAPCELIETPLVRYRQHDHQQHGGRNRGLLDQYRAARNLTRERCEAVAVRFAEALERLSSVGGVSPTRLELLRNKIAHHSRRAEMRTGGTWRLPQVVKEAYRGNYRRYGQGWKTIAQDLLLS